MSRSKRIAGVFLIMFSIGIIGATFAVYTRSADIFVYASNIRVDQPVELARWKERIAAVGGKAAYAEFAHAIEHVSPGVQHQLAHIFGAALYDVEGDKGAAVCDARFLFGCWHEFLGRAIATEGIGNISKVYAISESSGNARDTHAGVHALGHGLVGYLGYTLPGLKRALALCDAAGEPYAQECLEGAFMEYQLRFLANIGNTSAVRPLPKNADRYDPCDQLPLKYAPRCVENLPTWWYINLRSGSTTSPDAFAKIGDLCERLPSSLSLNMKNCFYGVGLTASYASSDVLQYERICKNATQDEANLLVCASVAGADLGVERGDHRAGLAACDNFSGSAKAACIAYAQESPWDTSRTLPSL